MTKRSRHRTNWNANVCSLTSNWLGILTINGRAHWAQAYNHTKCTAKGDDRYDQEGEQTNVKQTRNVFNNRIKNSELVYDDGGRVFIVTAAVAIPVASAATATATAAVDVIIVVAVTVMGMPVMTQLDKEAKRKRRTI